MSGIQSYASYLPYWRLRHDAIGSVLGGRGGSGSRTVASYDEDTTSMAVEASRRVSGQAEVDTLVLATTAPAYADKTNATAVHAALDLSPAVFVTDYAGSVRSAMAALRAAASNGGTTLVALSDTRTGLPGGTDEREGGDAAAAFVVGPDAGLAEIVTFASSTVEVLDRSRLPGEPASRVWEERFAEGVLTQAVEAAFTDALKKAGLTAEDVDRLVVTGVHARAARACRKALGVRKEVVVPDLVETIGNSGAAHPGVLLAGVLDVAAPHQLIALVVLADGADVVLLRTTDEIVGGRQAAPLSQQVADGNGGLSYADFLTWKGVLHREPPRRPDPDTPMGPPSLRGVRWKFGLVGATCERCESRFAPPQRVCLDCGAVDEMRDERFADVPGTVRTFTVDRLAFTPSPPLVAAIVDLDGGGRIACEVTDIPGASAIAVGDRVTMTFRRLYTVAGVHNYFWKALPERSSREVPQR